MRIFLLFLNSVPLLHLLTLLFELLLFLFELGAQTVLSHGLFLNKGEQLVRLLKDWLEFWLVEVLLKHILLSFRMSLLHAFQRLNSLFLFVGLDFLKHFLCERLRHFLLVPIGVVVVLQT